MRAFASLLVIWLLATGFTFPGPAPRFTGDDVNVHLQGTYDGRAIYVGAWQSEASPSGTWGQYCNQLVYSADHRFLGFYVDDSVSGLYLPPFTDPATNERSCVRRDRGAFPHALIIAATDGQANTTHLTGATILAREWYPYCGQVNVSGPLPVHDAYILQYNFVRQSGCAPTPRAVVARLWARVTRTRPRLLLYY